MVIFTYFGKAVNRKGIFEDVSVKMQETLDTLGIVSTEMSQFVVIFSNRPMQPSQTSPPFFCNVFHFECACVKGLVLAPFQYGEQNHSG